MPETNSENSILIADDNQDNLKVLAGMLEKNGYSVRVAANGNQVLASVEEQAPSLILLDVHMPKMDGYEACKILKENPAYSHIPIIFISALGEVFNKIKGFELGAVDYIVKPFELEEVKVRVNTHFSMSNKMKELEIFNKAMVDREMRLVELKEEVNQLSKELGRELPYPAVWKNNKEN